MTITLPLMFTQRYWAIRELGCLKIPHTLSWTHTYTHSHNTNLHIMSAQINMHKHRHTHSYTCMICWSEALPLVVTGCCWTGQLLSVQMIMTLSDHLFVVWSTWPPIHYAVSLQLHFWVIHALLSNYSLLLNECRKRGNE